WTLYLTHRRYFATQSFSQNLARVCNPWRASAARRWGDGARSLPRCSAPASHPRVANPCHFLCEDILHDLPVHIRQAVVTTLESEGQLLVIEPEQVHDRRLQIEIGR